MYGVHKVFVVVTSARVERQIRAIVFCGMERRLLLAAQQCLTRAAALLCRLISTGAGCMRTAAMDLAALSMFDTAASSPVDGDGQSRVCALAVAMDLASECRLESGSVLCRWRLTESDMRACSRD